jgi:hypothetical protein
MIDHSPKVSPQVRIERAILIVRGKKVILDAELAELYGVPTKRLNEQVKRNAARFLEDFTLLLTADEKAEVVAICDQFPSGTARLRTRAGGSGARQSSSDRRFKREYRASRSRGRPALPAHSLPRHRKSDCGLLGGNTHVGGRQPGCRRIL